MSSPFLTPQGRNINLDSLSFKTINTGVAFIDSTGTVTTKKISTNEIADSVNLPGIPTTATASLGTNTTQIATTEYVQEAIADLVGDNETISGIKTFSDSIVTSTATISGINFQNNTVYINGGFNWRIKELTNTVLNRFFTLSDIGFPYYQIYILNCSVTTGLSLDIPRSVHTGVRILFIKKNNVYIQFSTSSGQYIFANGTVNSTNGVGMPLGIYYMEFICDGTYWYQFNLT